MLHVSRYMPCFHCGKGILYGRSHTHHRGVAGGRWKKRAPKTQRIYEVNLQPIKLMIDGYEKRVRLCTRCIKRVKKDIKDGVQPFVTFASSVVKPVKSVKSVKPVKSIKSVKKAAAKK